MKTFEITRPIVGAQALGIARAAYEYALDYAKGRVAFSRPIIENQAIAFTLADMRTEIDAARLLVWCAAWMGRTGQRIRCRAGINVETEVQRSCRLDDRTRRPDPRGAGSAETTPWNAGTATPRSTPSSRHFRNPTPRHIPRHKRNQHPLILVRPGPGSVRRRRVDISRRGSLTVESQAMIRCGVIE